MKAFLIRRFTEKSHYQILGVSPLASRQEIKKAYYTLARSNHPDVNGSQENFVLINQAYDVLSDETKREAYDKQIKKTQSKSHSSASTANKYTFSANKAYTQEEPSKKQNESTESSTNEEKIKSSFSNYLKTQSSNWSGGQFANKENTNNNSGGSPFDAFLKMFYSAVIPTTVLVWGFITYATFFSGDPKEKFVKPEEVETRMPERRAARDTADIRLNN